MERLLAISETLLQKMTTEGQVIRYFSSGEIPGNINATPNLPQFIKPGLIEIDGTYLAATAYQRNPLITRAIQQFLVCFEPGDPKKDAPSWKEIPPGKAVIGSYVYSFTFEPGEGAVRGLKRLVETYRSQRVDDVFPKPSLREYMIQQRESASYLYRPPDSQE